MGKGESPAELRRCILKGKYHMPSHVSERGTHLLRHMLVLDPAKRATLKQSLAHNWLDGATNRAQELFVGSATSVVAAAAVAACSKMETDDEFFSLKAPLVQNVLRRTEELGFPQSQVEESLREGVLSHATATFHLLAQQAMRKKTCAIMAAPTRALSTDEAEALVESRAN